VGSNPVQQKNQSRLAFRDWFMAMPEVASALRALIATAL
jgi:hypothetical protein